MSAFEIPSLVGFQSKKFNLGHAQQITPSGTQGFVQTINRTAPFWTAEYQTPPLDGDTYNEAISFLEGLEGSMNTFLAYDPRRIMPYAYRNASLASNPWGTPNVQTVDYANSTILMQAFTAGAVITKGDYISFQADGIWYLYRSLQTYTVLVSGIAQVTVKPRPIPFTEANPVIRYKKACAEMKLVGDFEEEDDVSSLPILKFRAGQFINRAA